MDTKHTLAMFRQTLIRRKAIEDQVRQAIEPIKPTLRFIAELQAIYQEVYGAEPVAEISEETAPKPVPPTKATSLSCSKKPAPNSIYSESLLGY